MRPFLRHGFAELMRQERPDVVVCTLPVVNGLLAHAADATGARLEVVLTDWHSVHPFWVSRGVDHYTAPTDSARGDCIRFGARPDAVDVVGIPVRTQFATASSAPPADLAAFGLQPGRPTVLAMVGAEGSPRALRNVAALVASDLDAQLLVVCGNSHGLRRQVEQLPARMPLSAVGFVENIAALMRACDVLVTKAGGLTLAEAFCCGIPVVIHDLLPGQEAGNLEYVLGRGAAEYAPAPTALVATLARLIGDRARREALSRCGAELARPRAAADIAANVLARLAP
jgi:UDP-N-acetylglucosamine:LPS N-acetylglucosamine transferase